jgi:ribonuclease J
MNNKLRIIPLGGLGEVGINMIAYEFGDDIIVVDMGIGFPGEVITGVQYLLPNPQWLVENQKRIRGLILTHGHMDHTGAIPHLLPKIGFPPTYSLPLTIGLVKRRLEEFTLAEKPKFIAVGADDTLALGNFSIRFFRVNHSIPDGVGLSITTPVGQIIHTGDWKLDYTPGDDQPAELNKLARFADEGVLALLSDSTNSRIPGYSISEQTLASTINSIFDEAKARILFTCNALILTRIQQVFYAAARHNRKVLVLGRSMLNNIEVAISLGYLKVSPSLIIKAEQARKLPDRSLVILTTGGQGEELAGLPRMARGEHRQIRLKPTDTAVVSANAIPGNERPMQAMITSLAKQGVHVVYSKILDVHASGHARQDELKLMLGLTKPLYFIPIHGEHHMLVAHGKLAESIGMKADNIFVAGNGNIIEFDAKGARVLEETVPADYLYVNESGAGAVDLQIRNHRQQMKDEGMVTIVAAYDKKTHKLKGQLNILSRGFVYVKNNEHLFRELSHELQKLLNSELDVPKNRPHLEELIMQHTSEYLQQKTNRRPFVAPVLVEV